MLRLKVLAVCAALVAILPIPAAHAAPPIDGAALASDCNADGFFDVADDLRVVGGVGTLSRLCFVRIAAATTLTLQDVVIDGPGGFIVGDALGGSRLRVFQAAIDLTGPVQLATGCCSGDQSRDESGARALVVDSFVRGTTVEVSASVADASGSVKVKRSTLEATGPSLASVFVGASLTGGPDGKVSVGDSKLIGNTVTISTGADGATTARRNEFGAAVITVSTGPGGSCTSTANDPAVPCT